MQCKHHSRLGGGQAVARVGVDDEHKACMQSVEREVVGTTNSPKVARGGDGDTRCHDPG